MGNTFLLSAVILAFVCVTWWYARFTSRLLKRCQQEVAAMEQRALANAAELQASYSQTLKEINERQHLEDKYRESEARFAAFMRHFPGSATMRDLQGRYVFANETFEKAFGHDPGAWLGRGLEDVWPSDRARRFQSLDKQVLATRLPAENVEAIVEGEVQQFWLMKRFPILNGDGHTMLVGDISLDITDSRQAEEALYQEKERYRILAEESPLGIAIISKKGTYKYLNPKFVEMFGYTLADIPQGRAWFGRAFPDPQERRRAMAAWFEDLQPVRPWVPRPRTFTVACKDGAAKTINFRAVTLTDGDHLVIYEDDTGRHRAQEALKQSELKFRTLVNTIPAVVFRGYADWSVEFFDHKIEALTGYAPEAFASRQLKWSDLVLPEDLPGARDAFMEALHTDRAYIREYRIRHKNGGILWLQSRGKIMCRPDGKIDYITGVFFDITRQKEMEEALRAERNRLETVTRHMGAGLAVISKDHRILWANKVLREAYGDCVGESCFTAMRHSRETGLECGVREVLEGREKVVHEYQTWDSQGRHTWSELITTPVRGESGEVDAALQLVLSVTERKQAEEALRESEKRYRLLAENVRDVIWTADLDLKLTYVSPSVLLLCGYTPEEAMTKEPAEVLTPASLELALSMLTEALTLEDQAAPKSAKTWTLELEILCRDGATVWTETKASFLRDGEDRPVGILGVCRDIGERKRSELALLRREAILEAIGFAAERFLKAVSWEDHIQEILEQLGQAAAASRAYIFANQPGADGAPATSQRYEWVAPGILPQADNPAIQDLSWQEAGFHRWAEELSQGGLIVGHVNTFPPGEQEVLAPRGIKSILVVPIFVGQAWWGLVGFDECLRERDWSPAELEALKAAASIMGAAFLRERAQRALTASEEKLRSLSYRLLDAQESERKRLAAELHDELGHALLTLKLQVESLERQLEPVQVTQKNAAGQILRFIGQTLEEVRRLYLDLTPGDLEDLGLTAALRALIEDFAALRQEMTCTIALDNLEGLFPLPVQTAIYRVVQEALTNIGKHAQANRVSLAVKRAPDQVAFCVEDNGQGLDPAKVLSAKKTLGLLAMEERVKFLGGSFELASQKAQGTRISFSIPLLSG
jgi:PAS domain S-box-containing protein